MVLSWWGKFAKGTKAARPRPRVSKTISNFRMWLERLEDRLVPSTLDITTGSLTYTANAGVDNNLSIAVASGIYTFTDTAETITLTLGAMTSGWSGSGTNTVVGPTASVANNFTVNLLTGADVLNINGAINVAGAVSLQSGQGITLNDNITTSGNITLQAGGNITQPGSATIATGQTITATAAGSISVNALTGTTVTLDSTAASVDSTGSQAVQASGTLTLEAATGITLNTVANFLQVTNSTSGSINVTQLATPMQTLTITGNGVVDDAASGSITITNLGAGITVNAPVDTTTNGNITLAALDFQINAAIDSGSARTILANSVAGTQFDLGTNTAGDIGLTNAELGDVTAGVLQIGGPAAGSINVSAAISAPAGWSTLVLINNSTIVEAVAGSLNVANLSVSSTGPVTLGSANDIGNLAASTTNSFLLDNGTNALTIPSAGVDSNQGVSANSGDATLEGDSIDLPTGSTVSTNTGSVSLIANFAGTDPNALLTLDGTIQGVNITLSAPTSIAVDTLTATGTISITSTAGSISSTGSLAVQASDLILDAATGITLNTLADNLQATNSTSGSINITQLATPAQPLTITANGVVDDAATGTVTITNLGASIAVNAPVDTTGNGDITLAALDFQIDAAIDSGSARTVLANSVAGTQFDIGTNTAGDIGLTNAELGDVSAGVLQIGGPAAGSINVSTAISAPAGWSTLVLINNGTIIEAVAGSLAVPNLSVSSTGPVTLGSANDIGNLAASTTNSFLLDNGTNTLTIPNAGVDGTQGISTNNGDITLEADNIVIQQVIEPGTGTVTLEPATQSLSITVGTASVAGSTLGLTNAELGWITSGVTQVGVLADTGAIAVTDVIDATPTSTAPSRAQTLALFTGGPIGDNGGVGQITVQNLALHSAANINFPATAVSLTNPNNAVTNVAESDNSGEFVFVNSVNLTVGGPIAGLTGIDSVGGVDLTAPIINLAADVSAQAGEQLYNGPVTLANNVTLTGAEVHGITFSSTVESPGTPFSLTVDSPSPGPFLGTTFVGAVGGDGNPLASLSIPTGPIEFDANSVTTTGPQTYGGGIPAGNVIFAAGTTTLTSTDNQAINFGFSGIQTGTPFVQTTGTIALSTTTVTTLVQSTGFNVSLVGPNAATELSNISGGGGINLGNVRLNLEVSQSAIGDSYTIVSSPSGGITGTFDGLPNGFVVNAGGRSFLITYTATAVTLLDVAPLTISSPDSTTFTVGQPGSFTVVASGTGAASATFTLFGAPPWLSIGAQSGQLIGTPPNLGAGPYTFRFTITLSNSSTQQAFTLTVNQPPAITSPNNTTYDIDGGVFDITTTGSPTPTLTESGPLPSGVTFTQSDGRADFFITSPPAAFGVFPITITASNGVAPDATQQFTLTISGIPSNATTPNQRFIAQVYLDLFHQVVDTGGLAYWSGLLDQGVSRNTVVFTLERFPNNQFQTVEVEQIYQQFLHRAADPGGLQSGIAFLNSGGTVQQLSAILMGSAEFYLTQGGGTNQGFLQAMYQDALLRPIDPNALAVDLLYLAQGGNRTQLALAVSTSQEADSVLVEDAYESFLARQADPSGLAFFTQSLQTGATFEQVVAVLMASPEYQQDRVGG